MKIDVSLAKSWENRIKQTAEAINNSNLPLVLFGCVYYKAIEKFLAQLNVDVPYICDNDPNKKEISFYGCTVITPAELVRKYGGMYNVLILVPFEDEIRRQLQNLPFPPKHIFYLDFYFYEEGAAESFISDKADRFQQVFDSLSDKRSKEVFEATVNYWLCRDSSYLKPVSLPRNTQYFPDSIFQLSEHEVFVDGGAFNGDTSGEFIKHCHGNYKDIYAFEPDANNFKLLERFAHSHKNMHVCRLGLSDHAETVFFNSDSSSSKIDENGHENIKIDSLDNILESNINVTFLKMDVEGSECKALKGAENIIKRCRPKLAICTYHSISDMINVPLLIQKMEPDYSLYFRHYTNGIVETVCYALPPQ